MDAALAMDDAGHAGWFSCPTPRAAADDAVAFAFTIG